MRAVVQRVRSAKVEVGGKVIGSIGFGLLVLVGAHRDDTQSNAKKLADRIAGIRVFNDEQGKMNLPFKDAGGEGVLVVSNFTVYGDAIESRRPSFVNAAPYVVGEEMYQAFVDELKILGLPTQTGVFGADMEVTLVNDGPVTIVIDC